MNVLYVVRRFSVSVLHGILLACEYLFSFRLLFVRICYEWVRVCV